MPSRPGPAETVLAYLAAPWRTPSRLPVWPRLPSGRVPPALVQIAGYAFVFGMAAGAVGQLSALGTWDELDWLCGLAQTVPLLMLPWSPLAAWRICVVGMAASSALGSQQPWDWPWPATSCIAYLLVVLVVALRYDPRVAAGVGAASLLAVLPAPFTVGMSPVVAVVAVTSVAAVLWLGNGVRVFLRDRSADGGLGGGSPDTPPGEGPVIEPGLFGDGTAWQSVRPYLAAARTALWAAPAFLPRRPRIERPWLRWAALVLWLGVVTGMAGGSIGQLGDSGVDAGTAWALGVVQAVPLVALPWAPLAVWRCVALGMVLSTVTGTMAPMPWPWPATSCIVYVAVVFVVALRGDRTIVLGVGAVSAVAVIAPAVLTVDMNPFVALVDAAIVIVVLLLGDNIRIRQAAEAGLAQQEELRKQDLARQAVLEERSRIARELHDVVAHHMSMIAIQAEAAPYKLPDLSEDARQTFRAIRGASTTALTEVRRVIGLLRADDESAERVPQPSLNRLSELVEGARAAGMHVELSIGGEERPVPLGVDVSAYRIVQEALSNAGRHAPGAKVRVTVTYREDTLEVRVADDGRRTMAPVTAPAGGHGLVGMRERVTMLGGELHTGPADGGGFAVVATLPLAED